MAADPDPYFALPGLYGAPATPKLPRPVRDSERPFDPDDLPLEIARTEEEQAIAAAIEPSSVPRPGTSEAARDGADRDGREARRFGLHLGVRFGARER